jgi:hypothetical protein
MSTVAETGTNATHLRMRQIIVDILRSREGDALAASEVAYLMPWVARHVRFECSAHCIGDDDGSPFGYVTECAQTTHTVLRPYQDSQILVHLAQLMNQALIVKCAAPVSDQSRWAAATMAPSTWWYSGPRVTDLDEIFYRRHRARTPRRCPPHAAAARC